MKKPGKNELWQAGSVLLCVILAWWNLDSFGASEFDGGRITCPLFSMFDNGSLLLALACLVTFFYPRIAAVIALAASLLCLPLYLYFVAPGPFRSVFKGEYSVPLHTYFEWNNWAIAGILSLVCAAFVSSRSLRRKDSLAATKQM
jgi:hypothetical protein